MPELALGVDVGLECSQGLGVPRRRAGELPAHGSDLLHEQLRDEVLGELEHSAERTLDACRGRLEGLVAAVEPCRESCRNR